MDPRPFAGTTALVTGGARRLGRIMCLRLATLGANVVVHHHKSTVQAFQLASELQARGVEATALQADLSDPGQVDALVPRAREAAGAPLDFLVNNASSFPEDRMASLTWETLSESLRTNAWAPFALTRHFAAQAPRSGGAVVNLIDTRTADYDWRHVGYILAKRMLADMTQFLAVEHAPNIRVNGVSPGPVMLPDSEAEQTLQRLARHLPLRRTPSPDDVADAVLYLLGARGVTGTVLAVDGGRHLGKAVYDGESHALVEEVRVPLPAHAPRAEGAGPVQVPTGPRPVTPKAPPGTPGPALRPRDPAVPKGPTGGRHRGPAQRSPALAGKLPMRPHAAGLDPPARGPGKLRTIKGDKRGA